MHHKRAYPSILQVLGLLGIATGLAVVFALMIAPIFHLDDQLQGALTFFSYVVTLWLTSLYALKNTDLKWREVFGSIRAVGPLVYVILAALVLASIFIVDPLLSFFPPPEWFENLMAISPNVGSIITVVFAAAFLEEYLFRGIILRGFLKNYPPKKAILWSAVLFGIFHLNPWQFVAASFLGLYMGWIYYRTQSLWPCIFIHFANNLIATILYFATGEEIAMYDFSQNIPIALLSILGGIIAVYLIYKVLDGRLPAPAVAQTIEEYDAET